MLVYIPMLSPRPFPTVRQYKLFPASPPLLWSKWTLPVEKLGGEILGDRIWRISWGVPREEEKGICDGVLSQRGCLKLVTEA